VAIIILSILSLLIVGPSGYQNYLSLIQSPESLSHMQPELTPTLRGQLLRLEYVFPAIGQSKGIISVVTLAVYAMAIGFSFWLGGKAQKMERPIEVGVLASLPLTVVTSFHCHSYDLLLLTPTLLILFADRIFVTNQFLKLGIMLCGSIFMMPLCIYLHYDYLLKGGVANPWFLELVLFAGLIVILLLRHMKAANVETAPAIS
jgi:hypothetical protein